MHNVSLLIVKSANSITGIKKKSMEKVLEKCEQFVNSRERNSSRTDEGNSVLL